MIGLEPLRWALTLALVAGSAFHLVRSVRPAGTEGRPAESMYLLMGVAMVAMIWPWGNAVPAAGWVTVFVLAAGWFTVRAVRSRRRVVPAFFASAMAAMAWMGAAGHAGMPGMAAGAGTAWISGGLGVYLMLAAIWWVAGGMHLGGTYGSAARTTAAGPTAEPAAAGPATLRSAALGPADVRPAAHGLATVGVATVGVATVGLVAHPVRWNWLCHGMMTAAMAIALLAMA